jgi:ribose transport system ATP-binding protein
VRKLSVRCAGIDQVVATLSGGNQQKIVIGKWLATEPQVLLLDEPTRGIDVGAKQEIYEIVSRLAAQGLARPADMFKRDAGLGFAAMAFDL